MKYVLLLSIFLVSGCSFINNLTKPKTLIYPPSYIETSSELSHCPPNPGTFPPPPKPRTEQKIVDWANKTATNLVTAEENLEICRKRLEELNRLIRQSNDQ